MRLRRSPRELSHRLKQELRNIQLLGLPPKPRLAAPPSPLPWLPERAAAAAYIRSLRFPLLETLGNIADDYHWRKDYVHGIETKSKYFRLIPYLDATRAGDHKLIWEPNRHQNLVRLAADDQIEEVVRQLTSWFKQNPFQRGINWVSALEVAFRSLSWIWIYHFAGDGFAPEFRDRLLNQLYLHGVHLENNLSYYFSPNTHLLGEAVALHALGLMFSKQSWCTLGTRVVVEQMHKQVRPDGGHFEQSTHYHEYALDMFQFHASLEPQAEAYLTKLRKMEQFSNAVHGPMRRLPLIGDDDGGLFLNPFRRDSGRVQESILFPDTGLAVMISGDAHIIIDVGPFGPWSSGHSHADTLSVIVRAGNEDILIDPGTYTYMGPERNVFRGSAAHNTIRIDERDQAIPVGPFAWKNQPEVRILDFVQAECRYGGFTHRRSVRLTNPANIVIEDEVNGPPGEHLLEQFWHLGSDQAARRFTFDGPVETMEGWASSGFNEKHPAPVIKVARKATLPQRFTTSISLVSSLLG
jgi:hypothetical protein